MYSPLASDETFSHFLGIVEKLELHPGAMINIAEVRQRLEDLAIDKPWSKKGMLESLVARLTPDLEKTNFLTRLQDIVTGLQQKTHTLEGWERVFFEVVMASTFMQDAAFEEKVEALWATFKSLEKQQKA